MLSLKGLIKVTSPVRLLALLLLSIFLGELVIMILIDRLSSLSFWQVILLDASLLMCFTFPVMFCFLFRPLISQVNNRILAESILKKSEERYRNIFDNVQDVYYEISFDGIINEISPSVRTISKGQYSRMDLLGSSVYELYDNPAERDIVLGILYKSGEVRDYEVQLRNRDGSLFHCAISARLSFDSHNIPVKVTGSIRDISTRKRAEEELKTINDQLRVSNSEKDRLFSIISHDLRSPLSTFIGLTEIMAQSGTGLKPSEMQKFADSMYKSATSLYGLLENLLLWSRSKMHALAFELKTAPLLKEVEKTITLLSATAERKNIRIICRISPELEVNADINSLHTIMRNLISNAIKFTPRGGSIILSACCHENSQTRISVSDTGIGMRSVMISSLFSLDGISNRPGTEGEPSTGLGLLLCHELVKRHGGSITVESEENKGTTFHFTI